MLRKRIGKVLGVILLLFSFFILAATMWLKNNFGDVKVEEIIFNLKVPLTGTDMTLVYSFIREVIIISIALTIITFLILMVNYKSSIIIDFKFKKFKFSKLVYPFSKVFRIVVIIALLAFSIINALVKLDLYDYIKNQISKSKFIENNYVDPKTTKISFPENKRNLVYIYVESMESSYTSVSNGGIMENDLIPELKTLADENVHFSNSKSLGGAVNVSGGTWTAGAMVAQTAGLPLKIGIDANKYGDYNTFLPGVMTMGDILNDNGYTQEIMFGSDANYSGRRHYFEQHGNYKIWDYYTAIETGRMTEEDRVWWGFDDNDLFTYAKEELGKISQSDKPFNFTVLTADTHFEDGYLGEYCNAKYDDRYSSVIACESKLVYDFVSWIQEQDFYENTTIVISGDHLTMDKDYFADIDPNYTRTIYNVIINPATDAKNTVNRSFTIIDMFPTTIAALGATIDGDRLGLGTNLFSDKQTLPEKYGVEYFNNELLKTSIYYDEKFVY